MTSLSDHESRTLAEIERHLVAERRRDRRVPPWLPLSWLAAVLLFCSLVLGRPVLLLVGAAVLVVPVVWAAAHRPRHRGGRP
jgi:hypothetical protein